MHPIIMGIIIFATLALAALLLFILWATKSWLLVASLILIMALLITVIGEIIDGDGGQPHDPQ